MDLENFTYKNKIIKIKPASIFSTGLMFKKNSPPLLFTLSKEKKFSIHSFFCKPFTAIWLDKNKKPTKILNVKPWKIVSGYGKYLIEIPNSVGK